MRHVYFSFHYADVWKVNQIRQSGLLFGAKSIGFVDRSLWEDAKSKNKRALKSLIEGGLHGTTVTAVLIGRETWNRPWVRYEIERSLARGNALVGVHIHRIKDASGRVAPRGRVPALMRKHGALIRDWTTGSDFGKWVEEAWRAKNPPTDVFDSIKRFFT